MGKLNLANINAGLSSVKSITQSLDNLSHSENVPADFIHPAIDNPYSQEDTMESISSLAENIRTNGLIHPLAVNKISDDDYQLISGERRYKAITEHLHWKTIPCMVYDHISSTSAALKLHAANLEVRDYTTEQKLRFYEETNKLLHNMKESGEYIGPIQKGIADLLGVSDRQVRKYKAISEGLPEETKQAVIRGEVSINEFCHGNYFHEWRSLLMKKFTSKTKKIMVISGAGVVCVGILCAVLIQQNANAASNHIAPKPTSSAAVTSVTPTISISPIHDDTVSSAAKVESAWTPSSGENKTSSLAPAASKATPPASKPQIAGDSVNGKQPTNSSLTDKSKTPTYPSKDTTPQKDNGQTKNNGGTYKDPLVGGNVITEQGGNQQTTVGNAGDTLTGDKVGIFD